MLRVVLASLVASLGALSACHGADAAPPPDKTRSNALPPLAVEATPIEIRRMPKVLTVAGNVVADRQSEVAADVAGRVVAAPIERGQQVKLGETLATVDSRAAGFSVAAATAQAQLADTQAQQGQQDCDRADRLHGQGAMSQSEYDRAKTQCKAQQLQANAARAQAGLNSKLAADSAIRAPFAGVVGERYVNVGEYLQASTKVASIYVLDPVRVGISIPEAAVGLVKVGQTLNVRVSAWPERVFPAVVEFVSPALRSATRDLIIEARAQNGDGSLRPGMFASADLAVGEEPLPSVPQDAVVVDGTVKRIFLVRENRAFELVVQTGASKDGWVAVLEALDGGSRVIRHPPPGLRDGAAVNVSGPASASAAGEMQPRY